MLHFKRMISFATAVGVGVIASSSSLNAQAVVASAVQDTTTVVATAVDSSGIDGKSIDAGPRIVRANFAPVASGAAFQGSSGSQGLGAGSNVALMGVGAAGILVGSLVGGDGGTMISIGGGVIFFVGLFRWLR